MCACLSLLAWVAPAAWAQPTPSSEIDAQVARGHFQRGAHFYDQGDYKEAIVEFEAARRIKSLPALDFNIGRSYERLERWGDAADAYQRFLASQPPDAEPGLRERIVELRRRALAATVVVAPPAAAPPPARPAPPPLYRRAWFWIALVGGVAVATTAIGVGVAAGTASHPAPTGTFGTIAGN